MGRRPKINRSPNTRASPPRATTAGGTQETAAIATVCGLLLLAVLLVFGQTARHAFVNYDDGQYVYENPRVTSGLTARNLAWAFTQTHSYNWHPLTWLSHMLDWQLFGSWAGGHHLTNVLLHAANAILLFLVLRRMIGAVWPSALAAALFAIHPLRVESVAWVAERKDVLSGLFFMLTLAAYVRYVRRPPAWGRYLAVVGLFALGLMAKPMLVTLPLVLLLLDFWPLGRWRAADGVATRGRALLLEKIPLFAMAAVSCAVTLYAQRKAILPIDLVPWPWRITNALVACVAYLGQMFYPAGLAVLYPHPGKNVPPWEAAAALVLLAGISVAAMVLRRKRPYLLVGWLWYLLTLVPVIGLVQVGVQAMADRYTYLPQIGLATIIACAAADLSARWRPRRWTCAAAAAAVVAATMVCAWRQTSTWRDSETLWNHALENTSANCVAHANLGLAMLQQNRLREAIAQYREAAAINPAYAEAYLNVGVCLRKQGNVDAAIAWYRKAAETRPDYAEAYYNLGNAMLQKGSVDDAAAWYQKAVAANPDCADAHYNLGMVLQSRGRLDEGVAHFEAVLAIEPENAEVRDAIARLRHRGK